MRLVPIILSTGLALSSYSPAHAVVTASAANAAAAAANSANNASKRRDNKNPGTEQGIEQQNSSKTPDFCTTVFVENMRVITGNYRRGCNYQDINADNKCINRIAGQVKEVLAQFPSCRHLVEEKKK